MPQPSFRLTPIPCEIVGGGGETFCGIIGRKELATVWWKACPNTCHAHLPSTTRCCATCSTLRRHIGMLSRKMIGIEEDGSVTVVRGCKHDLVELCPMNNGYMVAVGASGKRPWMRFRLDVIAVHEKGRQKRNRRLPFRKKSFLFPSTSSESDSRSEAHTTKRSKVVGDTRQTKRKRIEHDNALYHQESQDRAVDLLATKHMVTPVSRKTANDKRNTSVKRRRRLFHDDKLDAPSSSSLSSSCSDAFKDIRESTQPVECFQTKNRPCRLDNAEELSRSPSNPTNPFHNSQGHQESPSMAGPPLTWLSLPLPRSQGGDSFSEEESPLIEETQLQFRNGSRCESMTRSDWESFRSKSSGFKSAMAELILVVNDNSRNDTKWLPPLLRNNETKLSFQRV